MNQIIDKIKNLDFSKSIKRINQKLQRFHEMKEPSKIEWTILGIFILICYVSFNHGDITATSTHGKDLLVCIFHGQFFEFYDYTESTAVYLIPIYILFAIWSVPVAVVYFILNIPLWGKLNYAGINFYVLMWYKLLPTVFCVLSGGVLWKIGELVGICKSKRKLMLYVFFSFPILIFSQFIFGQYDSIGMFFTLLALYFYLQKKYYKFALLFSLAITFKLFAIFLFLPLLLLAEKRVIHIFKYGILGMSGYLICNLLFWESKGFSDAKSFADSMIDRFFAAGLPTAWGMASYFCILFAGTCVFAYLKKIDQDSESEYYNWAVYICLVIYSALFMFVLWHPQWVIVLVPCLVLSEFMSGDLKASIMLNVSISIGYLMLVFYSQPSNVDEVLINGGIFPLLFVKVIEKGGMLNAFFSKFSFLNSHAYTTIFVGSLLINLVLKYPTEKRIVGNVKEMASENTVERGYYLAHLFTIFIYIVPVFYLYFIYY